MHATIGFMDASRQHGLDGGFAIPRAAPPAEPAARYGENRRPRWSAAAIIVGLHALAIAALVTLDVIPHGARKPEPLVVIQLDEPPPPPVAPDPQPVVQKAPVTPQVFVPKPEVETPAPPPPPVQVTTTPPPPPAPQAVVVAPAKVAAPAGPVTGVDLASKTISAAPPRYPIESRRKREQGTVSLLVLVGLDGRVSELSLAKTSGCDRLDKAAMEAVRRWRWQPTTRGGETVMVRGIVEIPFVLTG